MNDELNALNCSEDPRSYQACGSISNIGPGSSDDPDAPFCGGYLGELRLAKNDVPLYKDRKMAIHSTI